MICQDLEDNESLTNFKLINFCSNSWILLHNYIYIVLELVWFFCSFISSIGFSQVHFLYDATLSCSSCCNFASLSLFVSIILPSVICYSSELHGDAKYIYDCTSLNYEAALSIHTKINGL